MVFSRWVMCDCLYLIWWSVHEYVIARAHSNALFEKFIQLKSCNYKYVWLHYVHTNIAHKYCVRGTFFLFKFISFHFIRSLSQSLIWNNSLWYKCCFFFFSFLRIRVCVHLDTIESFGRYFHIAYNVIQLEADIASKSMENYYFKRKKKMSVITCAWCKACATHQEEEKRN